MRQDVRAGWSWGLGALLRPVFLLNLAPWPPVPVPRPSASQTPSITPPLPLRDQVLLTWGDLT